MVRSTAASLLIEQPVRFNHGASIDDVVAIGPDQEPLVHWKERCKISPEGQVRLVKLSHMRYQHPDLEQITTFLQDFGMTIAKRTDDEIWYKGYGTDQYVYYARKGPKQYLGGTFEVETFQDLERATTLPKASGIKELAAAPGGGHMVTVYDPEGFPVNLIFGQTPAEPEDVPVKLTYNYEMEKPRLRKFQRFEPGPAAVHKLGHFGLCSTKFEPLVDFYTKTFNLVPSDFLYIETEDGKRKNVALFAHIDRGDQYVDHHSFFLSTNATSHVHHCSFEVHDFDTQKLGHQWLAGKEYTSVWGVGRHILGSQIFDYWWDTTGNMVEHYADGDSVNNQTPVGYGPAGDESLAVWGPEVPAWFLQ
ncbi:Glyoxalase/Bleomycin resistance protein/Dihydroxybiphenyl dioxygenase [Aspergillus pseudoustus]|uniref:Glyoxalase/Bleomycin resistance protein/Dihydroxybiphenyl dioxygenase n=1 Tax=Aspergillus pseudoustus TaxID=1810923 RepID=A0ABR4JEP9_9EURO